MVDICQNVSVSCVFIRARETEVLRNRDIVTTMYKSGYCCLPANNGGLPVCLPVVTSRPPVWLNDMFTWSTSRHHYTVYRHLLARHARLTVLNVFFALNRDCFLADRDDHFHNTAFSEIAI